jgi:Domain of unknown function (DUF4157)
MKSFQRTQRPSVNASKGIAPSSRLTLGSVWDASEQEADRVAQAVTVGPDASQTRSPGSADGAAGALPHEASQSVHEVLGSKGEPLDPPTRVFMERRFGHDFSRVRIHAGARAADSARSVGAVAYTVGDQIAFGHGSYQPRSPAGRQLIAHELAHTLQRGAGPPVVRRAITYPVAPITPEDPIMRVLTDPRGSLAYTTPTINSVPLGADVDYAMAVGMIQTSFSPGEAEPVPSPAPAKTPPPTAGSGAGSGSGTGSGSGAPAPPAATPCRYKDFGVDISAKIRQPKPPRGTKWGPTDVDASTLPGVPAVCRGKRHVSVTMIGKPTTKDFYAFLAANEQDHVKDLKAASNTFLVPYYQSIMALRGTGAAVADCKKDLDAQRGRLSDRPIRSFLDKVVADIAVRDVPGGHQTEEDTHVTDPSCSAMEITGRPKPPPPRRRAP